MHSKQYFHRDLKPENILLILNNYNFNNTVPGELKVKIADFGTAKEIPINNILPMTDYVCTRWYRPPECILRADNYDEKMDVWAIGCVMAELYNLGAIFPGENEFDQLNQILKILGTPTKSKWPWGYFQTELYGIQLPIYYKKDFAKILGYICQDGVNLLNEIFTFDPIKRPSCSKILNHPYFKSFPKPKINIIPNTIRTSNRNNTFAFNKVNKNNAYSYNPYKNNNNINNRTNNNSINKTNYTDNALDNSINKNNMKKPIKRNATLKTSSIIIDLDDYKKYNNFIDKKTIDINNINKTKIESNINNHNRQKINNISTTDRKIRTNNRKYVKIVETKSGIATKKNLRYNIHNEESKINDNKNYDRKELIFRKIEIIGRNEDKPNNSKKLSFINNRKIDEKEGNRNKSIDTFINHRNSISSTKYQYTNNLGQIKKPINDIKKINNYTITYDNKNNNNYRNHKEHYINYKADRSNINKNNAKSFYLRRNERNMERNSGRNSDRNSERNNNKILLGTKNLNYHNDKKKERKNHKFYESKDNKYNKYNNHKYININNYNTYKDNIDNKDNKDNNNNKHNHNHNNICICSVGRNYSVKRNLLYEENYRYTAKNSNNLKKVEFRNNTSPKNRRHATHTIKNKNISQSPIKNIDKMNSLFSSFINSKNNDNNSYDKSRSLSKINNSKINLNQDNNFKKRNNNNKTRIKIMKAELLDDISYNNIIRNYIPSSTSKKENYRNTKN